MPSFVERLGFDLSLRSPAFFRYVVRPELYRQYGPDPEDVHEAVLEKLPEFRDILERHRPTFPELEIELKGHIVLPFSTAPGLDKNFDIGEELACLFGILKPGTLFVDKRIGNDPQLQRIAVDEQAEDGFNAQGFPSKGREYFLTKLDRYSGKRPVIVSVCGLPCTDDFDKAYEELETLCKDVSQYSFVIGVEWDPFSPNTASLVKLRTNEVFRRSSEIARKIIGSERLLLVKTGPYEEGEKNGRLALIDAFMLGGGDGISAVNTKKVPKNKIPSARWAYDSAGVSGRSLAPYRKRAVNDARDAFGNDVIIFAVGGLFDCEDVYESLRVADAVEYFTPCTFYGLGLPLKHMQYVSSRLKKEGYANLREMQMDARNSAGAIY